MSQGRSRAQPRGSAWRNHFAASPVSRRLCHLASVSKSPPLQLTSSHSRERAGPDATIPNTLVLHSKALALAVELYLGKKLASQLQDLIGSPQLLDLPSTTWMCCRSDAGIQGRLPASTAA